MVSHQSIKRLSERERKVIASLKYAKYRAEEGLFVAEGVKSVELLLPQFRLKWLLFCGEEVPFDAPEECCRLCTPQELKKLSTLQSRQELMAVFHRPEVPELPKEARGLAVALEEVQDPGNLGTIIRLCDWLGIQHLFCSKGCADPFNTKTVQASMGALGNVTIHEEVDLLHYLPHHFDVIMATDMKGMDYRKASVGKSDRAVLLLGNEGRGLSEELLQIATTCLTIPSAPSAVSDSLNVSISAAILLSNLIKQ